jgi:hypothetical protein
VSERTKKAEILMTDCWRYWSVYRTFKWSQVQEAMLDVKTSLFFLLGFVGNIPNAGISNVCFNPIGSKALVLTNHHPRTTMPSFQRSSLKVSALILSRPRFSASHKVLSWWSGSWRELTLIQDYQETAGRSYACMFQFFLCLQSDQSASVLYPYSSSYL